VGAPGPIPSLPDARPLRPILARQARRSYGNGFPIRLRIAYSLRGSAAAS